MNTTPTKEQIRKKHEGLQMAASNGYFMKLNAELEKHNTAQAQEILELKNKLFDANEREDGLRAGYARIAEALNLDEHRAKWFVLGINELKAYVNELRELTLKIERTSPIQLSFDGLAHWASNLLQKTPTQSLQAHNAAIEDGVIEACVDVVLTTEAYTELEYVRAIRNMPRKYKESEDKS